MKESAIAIVITGVVAAGAGIAIAGSPGGSATSDLVIIADTSRTTTPELSGETLATSAPSSPATDVVRPTTTAVGTPRTSPTAATSTTLRTVTTTTDPPVALRDPAELVVATANASASSGIATATAEALREFGYDASPVDAEGAAASRVYYAPGFEREAARIAAQLSWTIRDVGPMTEMPPLLTERTFELVVLIGVDRA